MVGPIKIHNAEIKRMRKILILITKFSKTYKNVHWTVFEGEYHGTRKNS